jgi:hypothetical protein
MYSQMIFSTWERHLFANILVLVALSLDSAYTHYHTCMISPRAGRFWAASNVFVFRWDGLLFFISSNIWGSWSAG